MLQYGKKYLRKDGKMTGPMVENRPDFMNGKLSQKYPFKDSDTGMVYTENGEYLEGEPSELDLIVNEE